jgi:hypothetical protein
MIKKRLTDEVEREETIEKMRRDIDLRCRHSYKTGYVRSFQVKQIFDIK